MCALSAPNLFAIVHTSESSFIALVADNGNNLAAKGIFRNAATRSLASERPLWQSTEQISSIFRESRARSPVNSSGAFSSREITVFTVSNCSG